MAYTAPSTDTLLLSALEAEFERACDSLGLGPYQRGAMMPEFEESVVFDSAFFAERADTWDEDDSAAIRLVGDRAVAKQIAAWRGALDRLASDGCDMTESEAKQACDDRAEAAAEARYFRSMGC